MHVTVFFRHPRPEYNSIEEVFETVMQAYPEGVTFDRVTLPYSGASFKAIIGNLQFARRHRGKINHITGDVHYIAMATGGNTVLTIHDARSALRGSFIRRLFIKILWFWLPVLFVKKITVISPRSAEEVEDIVPFAKRKIVVVPNPYNPRVVSSRQLAVGSGQWAGSSKGKAVVLLVGTKVNKNLERTVEALDSARVKLIILGQLSDQQTKVLDRGKFEYESHFNVPYSKVAELYRSVDLVCFVSTYEGFGMPILEAQLASRPVVTSDIDPMKWVAGEGACLVDPYSVDAIRYGVVRLLDDDKCRTGLVRKGKENVKRFEPRVIAGMYCKVYGEVC